ncbi:MAG: hypothetical protein WBF08_00555 [Candidatus Bathyarchaeia archaeon]
MSEVISFRLNRDNPRGAQALEVLRAWRAKGYSTRHIITEALLNLDESQPEAKKGMIDELTETLSQVSQLLEQIWDGKSSPAIKQNKSQSHAKLTPGFVASLMKSAKPGVKLD